MLLVCPNHNYEATHKLPCLSSECVGEHSLIAILHLSDMFDRHFVPTDTT
jgi:hypothetical protein